MKKTLAIVFVVGMFMTTTASAQSGMMMGYPTQVEKGTAAAAPDSTAINAALAEIYASQNVTEAQQIICSKVTTEQLIKLGDAVMGYGITEEQHTAMENMMGGEESPMSKQAHENMGRSYLGCWANYNSGPMMMSMMGNATYGSALPVNAQGARYSGGYSGMMGQYFSGGNMMGGYYGFGGITIILFWILLILGILALIKWLRKN